MIKTLLRWSANANGTAPDNHTKPSDEAHAPPTPDEIAACLDHGRFLWLDVEDPTEAEFDRLEQAFGFHPLTVEDALRTHQRPKIDEYPSYFFLVFYSLDLEESGEVSAQQISVFVGRSYLITVHHGPAHEIAESARRWEQNQAEVGRSIGAVLYSLLDSIVDHYFPVMDQLVERIEAVEEEILERASRPTLARLFALKRELLRLRRVLGPERDVLNVLIRRDSPVVDADTGLYLQNVYDHVIRVTDTIDLYRDLLSSALDAYLSVTSNNLNQVMKRMTAISTILMSLALVTGIYGMNFKLMPELDWTFGYLYVLGLMVTLGIGLSLFFRKIGWF